MKFYLNLYITVYLLTLISLQYLLKKTVSIRLTFASLPQIITYVCKYSKLKTVFNLIFFTLTGLPPVFFFFIKIHILLKSLSVLNIIFVFFVFVSILLNIIFYMQVFYFKDYKHIKLIQFRSKKVKIQPNILTFIVGLCFFQIFSVFIFCDYSYIFKLILNWQH